MCQSLHFSFILRKPNWFDQQLSPMPYLPHNLEGGGPAFTANLACGWNWLVAKMGSCGLPKHLRRLTSIFLFVCFNLKKFVYVWLLVVGGKVSLPGQCRWTWVSTWLIAEGLGELSSKFPQLLWGPGNKPGPLPLPRLPGRGPGGWKSLLLFPRHLLYVKCILYIILFNSYNYPASRHYYLHFRSEGSVVI